MHLRCTRCVEPFHLVVVCAAWSNGSRFTCCTAAGKSLRQPTYCKARGAADLRRDSAVGCKRWLGGYDLKD